MVIIVISIVSWAHPFCFNVWAKLGSKFIIFLLFLFVPDILMNLANS